MPLATLLMVTPQGYQPMVFETQESKEDETIEETFQRIETNSIKQSILVGNDEFERDVSEFVIGLYDDDRLCMLSFSHFEHVVMDGKRRDDIEIAYSDFNMADLAPEKLVALLNFALPSFVAASKQVLVRLSLREYEGSSREHLPSMQELINLGLLIANAS